MTRCINIDWLEVYVLEPQGETLDADFFEQKGWNVQVRDYGTRIYEEMFKVLDRHGFPFLEVRRKPKSGGVLPYNAAHLRLDNRYCYVDNAAELMLQFIQLYHYNYIAISRIDICLDFEKFDSGDDPQKFIRRYIGHKYSKINQSQARAFFDDVWERRDFNSVSWGAKTSDISTKLYNKTLELYDEKLKAYKKPYIIQSWFETGLIDDPVRIIKKDKDGKEYKPTIWRLEFSITGSKKGWMKIKLNGNEQEIQSVRNNLDVYCNRAQLLPVFALLQQHYFHFKKHVHGKSKYECKDKILFTFDTNETFYRVIHPASPSKPDQLVVLLKKYLNQYLVHKTDNDLQKAGALILSQLEKEDNMRLCSTPFNKREWEALKLAIKARLEGSKEDPTVLTSFYRQIISDIF